MKITLKRVLTKLVKADRPMRLEVRKIVVSRPPGTPPGKVIVTKRRLRVRIDPV